MSDHDSNVAVVGAGPSGLAAACLVAEAGMAVTVLSGPAAEPGDDPRTIALMQPAMRLISHLTVWPGALKAVSAPLWRLKLIDDTGSLLTAGPAVFDAREIGHEPFGWNIPLAALTPALEQRARELGVGFLADAAVRLHTSPDGARLRTAGGDDVTARIVLAADGRSSRMRAAARINTVDWSYDQTALAASFAHSAPHLDTSIEFHKQAGPLTTVPLPGGRSSLVWLERPARAEALARMAEAAFAAELQAALHGDLGRVCDIGPRKLFAMSGLTAAAFARNRVMLLGEAGHVLPPIGAQGLNLGMRDAATAGELITDAARRGEDIGGGDVLDRYDRLRRRDILPRQGVVDAVNRSLLTGWTLPHSARVAGLMLAANVGPLRRRIMHQGLGPDDLPRVMQG